MLKDLRSPPSPPSPPPPGRRTAPERPYRHQASRSASLPTIDLEDKSPGSGAGPDGGSPKGGWEGAQDCTCGCGTGGELEALRAELKRSQYRARVLEKQRDEGRRERDAAEEEGDRLRKRIERQKGELRESERGRRSLEEQLSLRGEALRDLEEGGSALRASLEAGDRARAAAEGEAERLRRELEDSEGKVAALQGSADDRGRRIELLQARLEEGESTLREARWETRILRGDLESTLKAASEAASSAAEARRAAEEVEEDILAQVERAGEGAPLGGGEEDGESTRWRYLITNHPTCVIVGG